MYEIIRNLLEDKKGGITFNCFGLYHIIYMIVVLGALIFLLLYLRKKSQEVKLKAINVTISIVFIMYILDFFLMPFAYGKIDIEKLPFHICTITCVLSFLSRHNKFLYKYRFSFAILGMISNLIYFIYPAGVMWYQVHPLSYRVIQTLLYHGIMMIYGFLVVVFEIKNLKMKDCINEIIVLMCLVLWALIGNYMYMDKSYAYNWFFVLQDPFYIIPEDIAKFVMPFIVILSFSIVVIIFYLIYILISKIIDKKLHCK